jgi:nucleoside triphosphate diphosphatase
MTDLDTLSPIERLQAIMVRLRDPDGGCPWDIDQTFATIAPHTIEEAYEVADAIAENDMEDLKDELGDLMFQVIFYAQMAKEDGNFTFDDVVEGICEKMIRRHPHVFGTTDIDSAEAQILAWEETKALERARKAEKKGNTVPSALDGVSNSLPALTRAVKLQNRAARVGFDWPDMGPVVDKIQEELQELRDELDSNGSTERIAEEYGDLMFVFANLGRHLKLNPETVLRDANQKFTRRFNGIESKLKGMGKLPTDSNLEEMDELWDQVKAEEP